SFSSRADPSSSSLPATRSRRKGRLLIRSCPTSEFLLRTRTPLRSGRLNETRGVAVIRLGEQLPHFIIGSRLEIAIPITDGVERVGCRGADCFVGLVLKIGARFAGADRD